MTSPSVFVGLQRSGLLRHGGVCSPDFALLGPHLDICNFHGYEVTTHITTEGDNLTVTVQDSQGCQHLQVQVPAAAAGAAHSPRRAVWAGAGGAQLGGLRGGEDSGLSNLKWPTKRWQTLNISMSINCQQLFI